MIYQTVTEFDFIRAFDDVGRSEQFSRMALKVLFEHLSELSDVAGDFELDPIAICCEWAEYTEKELLEQYGDGRVPSNLARREEEAAELAEELACDGTLLVVTSPWEGEPDTFLYCE